MKSEHDPLISSTKSETPASVKLAQKIFLELAKIYVRSNGECPEEWQSHPELRVISQPSHWSFNSIIHSPVGIIPNHHPQEELLTTYLSEFKEIANCMESIATVKSANVEILKSKIATLQNKFSALAQLIDGNKNKKPEDENSEWVKCLQKVDDYLGKYSGVYEGNLILPEEPEPQSSCCQII